MMPFLLCQSSDGNPMRWLAYGPLVLGLLMLGMHVSLYAQDQQMAQIKGGTYVPLYGTNDAQVAVEDFEMDIYPVTNAQYLDFVQKYPKWQRGKVIALFAEKNYLIHWENALTLGAEADPRSPVTNISWFAAKAYCECQGKRLPTIDEWEYVAMANEKRADARSLKSYNQQILDWYETPKTFRHQVGHTPKNFWGVYDLHGLVWEWALDFNSVLISGESRKDVDKDSERFCGSAAIGASDLMNYAAFMRYAFRGSLKANYGVRNLGFRCVR